MQPLSSIYCAPDPSAKLVLRLQIRAGSHFQQSTADPAAPGIQSPRQGAANGGAGTNF